MVVMLDQPSLQTVSISGGHLAYRDAGNGQPVVLLHGGGLDNRMWDPQFASLAADHRVIAVDARGHGQSSTPRDAFRHTDDLAELCERLDIDSAVLIGISMGAGTAVDTAVEHPGLVRGLVISGTGTSAPDFRDPWVLDILQTWARTQAERDAEGWVEAFMRFVPGPHRDVSEVDPQVVRHVERMVRDTLANHVGGDDPVLPGPVDDVRTRAAAIDVPVLAIVGGVDSEDHMRMATDLTDEVADGAAITIERTAHYPNLEKPTEFNAALRDFLAVRR